MKTLIIALLLFGVVVVNTTAQDAGQRSWLTRYAVESAQKWALDRTYAESVAVATGLPIKKILPDGSAIELQRIENGIPMYYMTENINAARTISTDRVWPGGSGGFSLTGNGDTLGIWDEGRVRLDHQEFATGRATQVDGASTNSDHSTHVAGTMIAGGVQMNAKGMSYQARLRAWDWNSDLSEMANAALNGLRVSNHSYGFIHGWRYNLFGDGRWVWLGDTAISNVEDYYFGYYSYDAQQWDNIARNAPYYLIVKSAGNDRLEGPSSQPVEHWVVISGNWVLRTVTRDLDGGPSGYDCLSDAALAKNVLSVGAVNDIPTGYTQPSDVVMSGFSAWGPTDDGRIKPDIVANGTSLYSSIATSSTSYGTYSGTSMSAPNVSGSLGLLLQYHKSLYGNNPMRASTMKALVIHTSDEAGTNAGPDYVFGWGLMNTLKAVNLMKLNYDRGGSHIYERVLNEGQVVEIPIHVTGSQPLRVTICWTDPAGTPPAPSLDPPNLMLVNDLDLRVVSQGGTTYFPYILDPSNPSAGATTGDNIRDNVEQVHLQNPSAGLYTIRVTHKGTLSGGSQVVSVVVSGTDNILVNVDQRLDASGSIDSVGRWEGGPSFTTYAVPKQFSFTEGSQEVLRGAQKIISNQKYHRWNDVLSNVTNHRGFPIQQGMDPLVSNFHPTDPTITIKTDLLDAPGTTGGNITFHDPWYIDYPDPNYGGNLRNRGMQEPRQFHSRSSPFNPNYDTPFPPSNQPYRGVFLNENEQFDPNKPYYSVGAPSPQTIGNFTWNFINWTTTQGSASFQNANAAQTGVVFQSGNTHVAARMKAHLASSSAAATAPNNQRKIFVDDGGSAGFIYASGGQIWGTVPEEYGLSDERPLSTPPVEGVIVRDPSLDYAEGYCPPTASGKL
jgi:hypothetical protein